MNTQPTELDKAIEYYKQSSRQALQGGQAPHLAQLLRAAERLKEVEKELAQEKVWKEEDPRMLREQMRVADVAFQSLFERNKEVERERDAYFNRLGAHATAILNLEQELSELRTGYKRALEDVAAIRHHDLRDSHVASDCFVCESLNKILSTPLAIATRKDDQ